METFVSNEIGLMAKENGFNEPCNAYCRLSHTGENYTKHIVGELTTVGRDLFFNFVGVGITNDVLIENKIGRLVKSFILPTQSELQTWIRKKHNLNIWIDCGIFGEKWIWTINFMNKGDYIQSDDKDIYFSSYEDALEDCLKSALENIKNLNTNAE